MTGSLNKPHPHPSKQTAPPSHQTNRTPIPLNKLHTHPLQLHEVKSFYDPL